MADFTEYIRPIKYIDGFLDKEEFIEVHDDSTKVTFKLQRGTIEKNGHNGVHPIEFVKFALDLYKSFKNVDREIALIKTSLEQALLWDLSRSVNKEESFHFGYGDKNLKESKESSEIKIDPPQKMN